MTRESIKIKIAALLAKAEGTNNPHEAEGTNNPHEAEGTNNPHEAEAFMRKVNELLERHQMEMHEIRAAMGDRDPMGHNDGETNLYASMNWANPLAGALAKFYGCKYIYRRIGNKFEYTIIGRDSARMTFELMFPFIISQVRVRAKTLANDYELSKSIAERQIGQALEIRLWALAREAEVSRATLVGKGLIPVSDLDAKTNELFPEVKQSRATKPNYGYAAKKLADQISINVQTTNEKQERLS